MSGNESDKTHFKDVLQQFQEQFQERFQERFQEQIDEQEVSYFVADSALYTKDTIQTTPEGMLWVTCDPEVLKKAKELIQSTALLLHWHKMEAKMEVRGIPSKR